MQNQQAMKTDNLEYIDWLIDEKFIDNKVDITEGVRDELRKDLVIQIDNFVMARSLAKFSNEEVAEFEKLIKEGKTREDMRKYASEQVDHFSDLVTDALVAFQTIYLDK